MTYPSECTDYINAVTIPVSRSWCSRLTFEFSNIPIGLVWYQKDDLVNLYILRRRGGNFAPKIMKI